MLRGTLLVLLSRNFQKLSSSLIYFLLAWTLDRSAVGVYGLLVTTLSYAAVVGTLGLGPAHVHMRGQGRMEIRHVLANSLAGALLFGAATVAVFTLLRPYLQLQLGNPWVATLISLAFPLVLLQNYFEYVWIGENRLGIYSALYALRYATLPLLVLAGVLLPEGRDAKYVGMAAALGVNALLSVAINLIVVQRRYGIGFVWDRSLFARSTRYGLHVQVGSIAQAIGYRFDIFLINAMLGPDPLGAYLIATRFSEILWLLPSAVSTALLPRVSTGATADARTVTARTCRLVFALGVLTGGAVWLLAPLIFRVALPAEYGASVGPLRILLFGIAVFSLQRVLANYFIGQGAARWFQRATLISMAVNVGLNVWLIPPWGADWGIAGAAFSSAVSYSLSTAILAVLFLRWGRLSPRDILVPTRRDADDVIARLGRLRRRAVGLRHGRLSQP